MAGVHSRVGPTGVTEGQEELVRSTERVRRVDLNSLQIQTDSLSDPLSPGRERSLRRRRRGRKTGARAQLQEPQLGH
eukprot:6830341-Pyramimonas_sp.AAC.1